MHDPHYFQQDSADKEKIAEMRKLALLRKAAETARLQAKRTAASDGKHLMLMWCASCEV
jgi:hypothetical protein